MHFLHLLLIFAGDVSFLKNGNVLTEKIVSLLGIGEGIQRKIRRRVVNIFNLITLIYHDHCFVCWARAPKTLFSLFKFVPC